MKRLIIAAAIALAACTPTAVPSPAAVADRTVIDEKAAMGVELTYKVAQTLAETAVDAGLVTGARAAEVAALDRKAYAAVLSARAAYRAGNAAGFDQAAEAFGLIEQLRSLASQRQGGFR